MRARTRRATGGARALAARAPLLLSLAGCAPGARDPAPDAAAAADTAEPGTTRGGAQLVRALGCAACHPGVPGPGPPAAATPLGPGAGHEAAFLFAYLREPRGRAPGRSAGRMPWFHLSDPESLALALYLADGEAEAGTRGGRASDADRRSFRRARDAHPGVDREAGDRIFRALNCAACHPHPDATPWRNAPDLREEWRRARPEWLAGWLRAPTALRPFGYRPGTGGRMPDFALTAAEADSIAAFLLAGAAGPGTREAQSGPARVGADTPSSPAALSAHLTEKAARLLRDRLPCLGCHRLGDEGGRIAPPLETVARRRPPDYVREVVAAPGEAAPGAGMPRVPLPAATRDLVTRFLLDPPGARGADAAPAGTGRGYLSLIDHAPRPPTAGEVEGRAAEPSGPEAYRRRCASCHGVEGRADGFNARYLPVPPTPHASAPYMAERPSSTLFDGVYAGGRILGKSHRMPPFGESLPRERIWDLVAHMRALCACRGPDWSVDNGEAPARVEPPGGGGT